MILIDMIASKVLATKVLVNKPGSFVYTRNKCKFLMIKILHDARAISANHASHQKKLAVFCRLIEASSGAV